MAWAPVLLAAAAQHVTAQAVRSTRGQDPWLGLAGPLETAPGPAALFDGGPLPVRSGLWAARRALFGLPDLASSALAGGLAGRWGRWNGGLHALDAGDWQERQALLRWSPARPPAEGLDWALGLEARQTQCQDLRLGEAWLLADAGWRLGPLGLQGRLSLPRGLLTAAQGDRATVGQRLALGWELGQGWGLAWRLEREGLQLGEQAALALRRGDWGLAAAWRPGRGWEAAARARWRGLAITCSWWVHPVLPPTPAWGVEWRGEQRP